MSPGEKTDSWIAALAAELRADLAAAQAQVGIARPAITGTRRFSTR